ncbi:transcription factor Spi-B-like isoform X2 [Portunus trituberculatus]|uniref:transcription factor Spi-B-like isoform X2 n=1 Tax=Portunus trituberculatus TaxID=210409 RepID=UPI001E1CD222|nr:transcription factor Spi-B-like isoform X2 [Portunus trituberculatus]
MALGMSPPQLHSLTSDLEEMHLDPRGWPSSYHQDAMHSDTKQDILGFGSTTTYHCYPVNQWTSAQVQEWLKTICYENNIDFGNLACFAECTGSQLCAMSQSHFMEVHPVYGELFFRKFREYLDHCQRQDRHYRHHLHHQHDHHHHHYSHHHHHQNSPPTAPPSPYILQNPTTPTTYHELLARPQPPLYQTSCVTWQDVPYHHNTYPGDTAASYTTEGTLPPASGDFPGMGHNTMGVYQPGYSLPFECTGDSTPSPPSASLPMTPQYLPVGHLPTSSSPSSPSPSSLSPLPGQQADTRRDRGPKLWEFLLDLLEDPACNPAIIRWENQEERTFRLTSPHEVSLRWGQRRPNQNTLPYDYFARALRYHYKTGMLISVPERKLVYKFGSLVFQQRRRGANSLMYPESPHPDNTSGHPS